LDALEEGINKVGCPAKVIGMSNAALTDAACQHNQVIMQAAFGLLKVHRVDFLMCMPIRRQTTEPRQPSSH
jgi:hypothetical protein